MVEVLVKELLRCLLARKSLLGDTVIRGLSKSERLKGKAYIVGRLGDVRESSRSRHCGMEVGGGIEGLVMGGGWTGERMR